MSERVKTVICLFSWIFVFLCTGIIFYISLVMIQTKFFGWLIAYYCIIVLIAMAIEMTKDLTEVGSGSN